MTDFWPTEKEWATFFLPVDQAAMNDQQKYDADEAVEFCGRAVPGTACCGRVMAAPCSVSQVAFRWPSTAVGALISAMAIGTAQGSMDASDFEGPPHIRKRDCSTVTCDDDRSKGINNSRKRPLTGQCGQ